MGDIQQRTNEREDMSWTTANAIAQARINRGIEEAKAFGITDPVKAREIADRYWTDYNKTGDEKWLHLAHWAESVCLGARALNGERVWA
jgi:hypothetical protein